MGPKAMPKLIVDSRIVIESAMLSSAFKSMVAGSGEAWSRTSKGRIFFLEKIGDNYEVMVMPETVVPKPPAYPPPQHPLMTSTSKASSRVPTTSTASSNAISRVPKTKAMPKAKDKSSASTTTATPQLPTPKRTGTLKRCLDLTASAETQPVENAMDCT